MAWGVRANHGGGMKHIGFFLAAFALPGLAMAATDQWTFIAGADSGADFFVKEGSRKEVSEPRGAAFQIDVKHVRPNGQINLIRQQASKADCKKGQGLLYEYAMDGEQRHRNDFALNTNTTAAAMAHYICTGKVKP